MIRDLVLRSRYILQIEGSEVCKERINRMNTIVRLTIFLIVLVTCIPAQGEVLIYKKTLKLWNASEYGDDSWDIDNMRIRGYLVLDVNYTDMSINEGVQLEYWKSGRNKFLIEYDHEFTFKKIINGRVTEWILVEETKSDSDTILLMVRGKTKSFDIGSIDPNEVPVQLKGYRLGTWDDSETFQMSEWKLRLQNSWTRITNENNVDIEDAVNEIERILVEEKGYEWF